MQSFRNLDRHFGSISASVMRELAAVERARGRQEAFRRQSPAELETLKQVALVQSTEASNAIENITAPRERIEELVAQRTIPANRSEAEIAGYCRALDVIHANAETIPFEPRYVEQIHGYVYSYTDVRHAGHFKKQDNDVREFHSNGREVLRFTPVSADATPAAMNELHARFGDSREQEVYPVLLLTAAYALDFLVIHPFVDGNGRMVRLLTLLLLYQSGYEVGRFISLEKLISESGDAYYDSLARSTDGWHDGRHDLEPWCSYLLGVLTAAYRDFEERASMIAGRGSKRRLIESFIRSSISNEFRIEELRRATPRVSDSYLSKTLAALKHDGVIEPVGAGRGARWKILNRDF